MEGFAITGPFFVTMQPVNSVAVIGAGTSGVSAAAHLIRHGLSVTVFERSSIAGGVWHLDPESAHEPPYPNEVPSKGDYDVHQEADENAYITPPATPGRAQSGASTPNGTNMTGKDVEDARAARIGHAPPGPCYAGLKNNVSLTNMKTSLQDWPPGLEEFVSQQYLEEYIQATAENHGVNAITQYNTRVENIRKVGAAWEVRTTTLNSSNQLQSRVQYFDAVVVASGHYNMPRVPDIPGLREWKSRYPEQISHSKRYRDARSYRGRTVLLVGAGVSSMDIAKEIVSAGGSVVQSARGGLFDLPAGMLPEQNARRVDGLSHFVLDEDTTDDGDEPIAGRVVLTSGEHLSGIHDVILCTGYITSYPFLPDKHDDDRAANEVDENLLVTREGEMTHNLHKDIFYIPDPTLAFVGTPYHISTFSLFDFQAQVVARVFAGNADLPDKAAMRREYAQKVTARGYGRDFHSLRGEGEEIAYVARLVEWMNSNLEDTVEPMKGHTDAWHAAHRIQREMLEARKILKEKDIIVEENVVS